MRDAVDVQWAETMGVVGKSYEEVDSMAKRLKITQEQATFVLENSQFQKHVMEEETSVQAEEGMRKFRVGVKRRLLKKKPEFACWKMHLDPSHATITKEDMKMKLNDLYEEEKQRFQHAGRKRQNNSDR